MGASPAKADFIVSVTAKTIGSDTVYEFFADNNGANGTGTDLESFNITATMTTAGADFLIDTKADIDGDNIRDGDVSGAPDDHFGSTTPSFNAVTSTFMGLPASASGVTAVIASETVNTVNINGGTAAWLSKSNGGTISSAFGAGTVATLQMVVTSTGTGPAANSSPGVPFANIVVPKGDNFSLGGTLTGNTGTAFSMGTTTTGSGNISSPSSTVSLSLTNTVPGGSNLISSVTMHGSNGAYGVQSFAVAGPSAPTTGYLSVNGFSPNNDVEIYGLDASGEASLPQLISDLQAAVNAGATVETPTGTAGTLLAAHGDNIEVVFNQTGQNPATGPNIFSYDFSGYTSNGTVTISNVTVVPEPTSLTVLGVAGAGLLGRRRRRAGLAGAILS
jgi:hypothetical protein